MSCNQGSVRSQRQTPEGSDNMQINEKNIEIYGGKKRTIVLGNAEVKNGSVWNENMISPYFEKNQYGFKTLTVTIWMKGNSTKEIEENISDLLANLIDISIISDPDLSHKFCGFLKKHSKKVLIENKNTILTLEFSGYEFTERTLIKTEAQSIEIDNDGNLLSPAVLEIIPKASGALTVSGCATEPFTIKNVVQGQKIKINGITGEMTADGENKATDMEIWELPYLLPGNNTISMNMQADITVKYEARYF